MGRKRLVFVFGILVLLVVLLVEACAGGAPVAAPGATSASPPSAAAPAKPTKLRMINSVEPIPKNLSPILGLGGAAEVQHIAFNVYEALMDVGQKGEPVPKLATKWESSADLTKWRFYLRRGVKFHNGADFTARDVVELAKWSFEERKLSKLYNSVPVREAVAIDDYTVDLVFEQPQPLLQIAVRIFLIPAAAITKDNREMAQSQPVGTGPYRFVEWNKGLNMKLKRFEGYWGPKPQIDDVEIIFRGEEGVRVAALTAGEADWVYALSPEQATRVPKVVHIPSPDTVWIRFDEYIQEERGGVSIFADKRLRLAVEYAIDRQALVTMYGGFATPSLGQMASPGDFGFNSNLKSRPYDLEKARALVREAGAVGKTVSLVGPVDRYTKGREVTEAVAYMIEQTGLKVKLMLMPGTEANRYKKVLAEDRELMADMVITPTDNILEVETNFSRIFVEGQLFTATTDPEPTRLFKEEAAEADYTKRGEKLAKAWDYVYEQAHYVPLFKLELIWGLARNLEWKVDMAGRPFIADMRLTD